MWEPSKGGTGKRLNKNNIPFKVITLRKRRKKLSLTPMILPNRPNPMAQKSAIQRFESGPAMVISMSSLFFVFIFGKETCTGFPQPIIANPGLKKIIIKGISTVPIGSI